MKRKLFLGLCMATFIVPVARAQYPQLTEEAKQAYQKMMSEERRRSDEAWAKALPVVQKEAREGRPYISWASRPYDLPQARIPAFPGAEGGGMYSFGGRGGKVITVTSIPDILFIKFHIVIYCWDIHATIPLIFSVYFRYNGSEIPCFYFFVKTWRIVIY